MEYKKKALTGAKDKRTDISAATNAQRASRVIKNSNIIVYFTVPNGRSSVMSAQRDSSDLTISNGIVEFTQSTNGRR